MSCVSAISAPLTKAQLKEIANQKFRYTSPAIRPSLLRRLTKMSVDDNFKIRERAALDYNLPEELQWVLAEDEADTVRACLARNTTLRYEVMHALAGDAQTVVRGFLATNSAVPTDIIDDLAENDPDDVVRSLATIAKGI